MRLWKVAVVAVAAVMLAGCTSTAAAPKPTPTPTNAAGIAFCGRFMGHISDYATMLGDFAKSGTLDADKFKTIGDYVKKLTATAPPSEAATVKDYASPFQQIYDAIGAGQDTMTLTTDSYKTASVDLMKYCASIGYSAHKK